MSDFGRQQPCRNGCGAYIYFDRNSTAGHPSQDKWVPLQYNQDTGIKTDMPHQCPNRKMDSKTSITTETTTQPMTAEEEVIQLMSTLISKLDSLVKQKRRQTQ